MKKKVFYFGLAVFLLVQAKAFSQMEEAEANIYFALPQIALEDIEPGLDNSIHFRVNTSAESGESPFLELQVLDQLWIN